MEEIKLNTYIDKIKGSIDYKYTLRLINTYLLEMQSLLNTYDFNKRIHDLRLISINTREWWCCNYVWDIHWY